MNPTNTQFLNDSEERTNLRAEDHEMITSLKQEIEILEQQLFELTDFKKNAHPQIKKLKEDKIKLQKRIHSLEIQVESLKMRKPSNLVVGIKSAINNVVSIVFPA